MVSDRARAHELSARATTGVRAGGVPSFVDVASPSKPAVARGVRCAAWVEEPYRAAQCAWLDVCAEFSDAIEPDQTDS